MTNAEGNTFVLRHLSILRHFDFGLRHFLEDIQMSPRVAEDLLGQGVQRGGAFELRGAPPDRRDVLLLLTESSPAAETPTRDRFWP